MPPSQIVSIFGGPRESRDTFHVGFTHERYFALSDIFVDFLGVDDDMVIFTVTGPIIAGPGFTPQEEVLWASDAHEMDNCLMEPLSDGFPLAIGRAIYIRLPHTSQIRPFATLGHPTNSSGTAAVTTNHGTIPNGSYVYINNGGRHALVGIIGSGSFNLDAGMGVSRITMITGYTVSRRPTGHVHDITNFFAAADHSRNATVFAS